MVPHDEWTRAVGRWPLLLENRSGDPATYNREGEAILKRFVADAPAESKFSIAAITVDGLVEVAAAEGLDPADAQARAQYAASIKLEGRERPCRNDPCWCGSAVKYKRCCGSVPPADIVSG